MPDEFMLYASLAIAGVGSVALVIVAGMALFRRRSLSYFLITLAIGLLALRSFLGAATLAGYMTIHIHHVLEHLLDAIVIGLLFSAVYAARTLRPEPQLDESQPQELQ